MHPALLRHSGWTYHPRFHELDAAQRWGVPKPSDFDGLEKTDRVEIVAWYEARWRIDAVNAYEASKPAPKKPRKGRKK